MPMDWAVLIPLWFLGGRRQPPVPVVVVAPARDLPPQAHRRAGQAVAEAIAASGKRVAVVASADQGHGHRADGPYGFDPTSAQFDARIKELVEGDRLAELIAIEADLVSQAKADSWWQMLMLEGVLGGAWRSELLAYEAPTYYGMLTAAFRPRAG
jgi:aromatic ring-opening dioxygenase LigB subunit